MALYIYIYIYIYKELEQHGLLKKYQSQEKCNNYRQINKQTARQTVVFSSNFEVTEIKKNTLNLFGWSIGKQKDYS